jgi:hypothetical protein
LDNLAELETPEGVMVDVSTVEVALLKAVELIGGV